MTDVVELTAKVDAVDYRKRLVTLTGPRGNTVVVKAGPEVKNLEQIKPATSSSSGTTSRGAVRP